MSSTTSPRMTDALERDLLGKAMRNQFRFRPVHTLGSVLNAIALFVEAARAKTNARDMV